VEETTKHNNEPETPLAVQWGVTPSTRVWVGGHNLVARRETEKHLAGPKRPPSGPIDVAFIAPQTIEEALYFANKLRSRLTPGGAIWVAMSGPNASMSPGSVDDMERMSDVLVDAGWVAHDLVRIGAMYGFLCLKPE